MVCFLFLESQWSSWKFVPYVDHSYHSVATQRCTRLLSQKWDKQTDAHQSLLKVLLSKACLMLFAMDGLVQNGIMQWDHDRKVAKALKHKRKCVSLLSVLFLDFWKKPLVSSTKLCVRVQTFTDRRYIDHYLCDVIKMNPPITLEQFMYFNIWLTLDGRLSIIIALFFHFFLSKTNIKLIGEDSM